MDIKQSSKATLDILIISIAITIKAVLFSYFTGNIESVLEVAISTFAAMILISCWTVAINQKIRLYFLIGIDLIATILILGDLIFHRYYNSFITIPMIHEITQISGVSGSIIQLLKYSDFIMFLDFLLIIPFVYKISISKLVLTGKSKSIFMMVCGSFAIIVLAVNVFTTVKAYGKDVAGQIYSNNVVLSHLGIINYHLVDLIVGESANLQLTVQDIQHWRDDHNKTDTANLKASGKGKNLIIVQMEAMQNFVINLKVGDQEVTPNLNKFIKESHYYDNYFTQISQGNTSDAELMTLTGMYPLQSGSAFVLNGKNNYQSLPDTMKTLGYKSYALHSFNSDYYNRVNMYKTLGFEKFFSSSDFTIPFEDVVGLGLSDEQMFKQSLDRIQSIDQPSVFFLVSLSAHHPFTIPKELQELNIPSDQYSQLMTDYLQAQHYADKALGEFLDGLRAKGIMDNSVISIYGDHFGPGLEAPEIYKALGKDIKEPNSFQAFELNKVPLILRIPGEKGQVIHKVGGQIDLFPTLLNIMGADTSKLLYFGNDLINGSSMITFRNYISPGSVVNDSYFFTANLDGVYSHGICYNRSTGNPTDISNCTKDFGQAKFEVGISDFIIKNNNLDQIIGERK